MNFLMPGEGGGWPGGVAYKNMAGRPPRDLKGNQWRLEGESESINQKTGQTPPRSKAIKNELV